MRAFLRCRSHWSLGDGVSTPGALTALVGAASPSAVLGLTDVSSLAGLPQAAASSATVKLLAGIETSLPGVGAVLLFPETREGLAGLGRIAARAGGKAGAGVIAVGLDPATLGALAAMFPGRAFAGVDILPDDRSAREQRRRTIEAARAEGLDVVATDEIACAHLAEVDLAVARRGGRSAHALERALGQDPARGTDAIVEATAALAERLPDARSLLAAAEGPSAHDLGRALRGAADRLRLRVRLRPGASSRLEARIEPHSGPALVAQLAASAPGWWVGRASERRLVGLRDAAFLAGRAARLGHGSIERLLRAAAAETGSPRGPSPDALAFHKLDPADPAVARAASLVPLLAALPNGLAPGRTIVAGAGEPVLPLMPAAPIDVVLAEVDGVASLGYATLPLHADPVTGVLGELGRLGVVTSEPVEGSAEGFGEALTLAQAEARSPAAVLCARLRSAPGLSAPEVRRLLGAARRRGVRLLPARVDRSAWLPQMEGDAVRVGLHAILGPSHELRAAFERATAAGPPETLAAFARQTGFSQTALRRLAVAGALRPYTARKTDALRQVDLLRFRAGQELPLFA